MDTRDSLTQRLESKILADIPIAKLMGFVVFEVNESGADCGLPLEPNTNHLGTQFGGSLYAAGALSCYTALMGLLARQGLSSNNIVITEGHIEYVSPGSGDVRLQARLPQEGLNAFATQLRQKGRARLKVETVILDASQKTVARVNGEYLVRLETRP
jgi:thioesterase domain-containing protein